MVRFIWKICGKVNKFVYVVRGYKNTVPFILLKNERMCINGLIVLLDNSILCWKDLPAKTVDIEIMHLVDDNYVFTLRFRYFFLCQAIIKDFVLVTLRIYFLTPVFIIFTLYSLNLPWFRIFWQCPTNVLYHFIVEHKL